jgi:hypothetical protein
MRACNWMDVVAEDEAVQSLMRAIVEDRLSGEEIDRLIADVSDPEPAATGAGM